MRKFPPGTRGRRWGCRRTTGIAQRLGSLPQALTLTIRAKFGPWSATTNFNDCVGDVHRLGARMITVNACDWARRHQEKGFKMCNPDWSGALMMNPTRRRCVRPCTRISWYGSGVECSQPTTSPFRVCLVWCLASSRGNGLRVMSLNRLTSCSMTTCTRAATWARLPPSWSSWYDSIL